jgi:5-dehydro-4-deoxyglucarate dehydratase
MSESQDSPPLDLFRARGSGSGHANVNAVRERLRLGMSQGALSSALTPFGEMGELDAEGFRLHVKAQLATSPGALFVGCGTGEFFSLSLSEYQELVAIAVEVSQGDVPVIAGIGYGWAMAVEFASAAEGEGADAGLYMPHYLDSDPPDKIVEQVLEVTARTSLPLIVCERGPVPLLGPSTDVLMRVATIVGIKDCHGDVLHAEWMRSLAPSEWLYYNGAAGAEAHTREYSDVGIPAYSSPLHSCMPEVSGALFTALQDQDDDRVKELLDSFFAPFNALLRKRAGYAVSVPKAAARLRGARMGSVRSPLVSPQREDLRDIDALVTKGLELVASG